MALPSTKTQTSGKLVAQKKPMKYNKNLELGCRPESCKPSAMGVPIWNDRLGGAPGKWGGDSHGEAAG